MDRTKHFTELNTGSETEMKALAFDIIEEIIGDISTIAGQKFFEINSTIRDLNLAWNAKKTLAPTRAPLENNQLHSTIDVSKVESLLDFPLIELGPACKNCPCFMCIHLYGCHILRPSTLFRCKKACGGTLAFEGCDYASKEIKK